MKRQTWHQRPKATPARHAGAAAGRGTPLNPPRPARAAALLEVVLAMAIFLAIAGVALGSLYQCTRAVGRLRLDAQAADIAATILSEIQLGRREVADTEPEPLEEPLDDWTYQVTTRPDEIAPDILPMTVVEIIITNPGRGFTYRLGRLMPPPDTREPPE